LYQAALKYYITRAGENFAEVSVLMLAPTGKAAYNIKGNTIHSALAIPACPSLKNYKSLDSSQLNTLNAMFTVQVDNRLKDIKGSALPFSDVSIIAIGDLFQLQPVMDGYMWTTLKIAFLLKIFSKNVVCTRYRTNMDTYKTCHDSVCCWLK